MAINKFQRSSLTLVELESHQYNDHLSINISWKNGKLHGITALEINFLISNQLLVNINQLFEILEKKK